MCDSIRKWDARGSHAKEGRLADFASSVYNLHADAFFVLQAEITRSKDEARKIIEGYQERIKSGETTLGDLAVTESDCSSARKRGDLGYFGRGDMQAAFEEAAFALEPTQISGVVDTASGLHLIQR